MAHNAAQRDDDPQRANLSLVGERKADKRTEAEDLRMELAAFHHERHQLGLELRWLGHLIYRAVLLERDDLAVEASGRLDQLSGRLIRQNGGSQ